MIESPIIITLFLNVVVGSSKITSKALISSVPIGNQGKFSNANLSPLLIRVICVLMLWAIPKA